jgi:hypothetical protein
MTLSPERPLIGQVLVDNTTLFGARRALEAWPPSPDNWLSGSFAVDLQSLVDTLEMLVLHDELLVESSSRDYPIWPGLMSTDESSQVIRDMELLPDPSVKEAILRSATASLSEWVRTGALARERSRVEAYKPGEVLPDFYDSTDNFAQLTAAGFPGLVDSGEHVLEPLVRILDHQPSEVVSYATFIFRGVYYQHLAHALSISYQPHAWRASFVSKEATRGCFSFANYALDLAEDVRSELTRQLNSEFGTQTQQIEFPLLASFIASQATRRDDLLTVALQLRQNPHVVKFREWVRDIDGAVLTESDPRRVNDARKDVVEIIERLRRDLGLPSLEGPGVSNKMTVEASVSAVFASAKVSKSVDTSSGWHQIFHRRPHLLFLKNISQRSVSISPFQIAYSKLPA